MNKKTECCMYRPGRFTLLALLAYCVLVKVTPYVLWQFGMDIHSNSIYPWTFTPIFAVGILGAGLFRNLRIGLGLPIVAFAVSDLLIGLLAAVRYGWEDGLASAIYPGMVFNYLALVAATLCGTLLRGRTSGRFRWVGIFAMAVLAPSLFFLISNFGAWAFVSEIGFSRDLNGLWQAYVAGLPFYRNSLISTVGFCALLFSPLGIRQLQLVPEVAPAKSSAVHSV